MTDMEDAGKRLEDVVRMAMPRVGIASIAELCRQADVTRNTAYDWFRGATVPTPKALERVARVVKLPVADLWAAYQGTGTPTTSLEDALGRLATAQERQNDRLDRLIRKMDALASAAIAEEVRRYLSSDVEGPPQPVRRPRRTRPKGP